MCAYITIGSKKSHSKLENTEMNEIKNITYHKLQDEAKAMLRGKFITINAYIIKISQINSLPFHIMIHEK